ncbi:MAG TPA: transglutaminase-like domain-containing protein, partial [Acidimicrobiales bacterium]|nr:transglutaminase-like domain-containing protein [Acidimicrobiales bacterium]
SLVPAFGAVQQVETPPGEHYSAVARVPVTPSATARGGDAPAPADLAPYLELPSLGARVVRLAHQIVAGATTPAAKAGALARWFNGGRFRYTLTPPRVRGGDALSFFLFSSHAGFCQQFAAAYAVLARIDGLPARVAVGFTTGTAVGTDQYRVSGADAHVWPEVYLGPSVGWTSYEPTPATSGEASGIGVNSGARAGSTGTSRATGTTASTVVPSHHPTVTRPPVPTTTPLVLRGHRGATTGGARRAGGELGTAAAVGGAVLVTALVVLALWRRRGDRSGPFRSGPFGFGPLRRRRRARADPTEEVLAQWHEAQWTLERLHLGRRPEETLLEHAGRLQRLADADWLTRAVVAEAGGADPVDAYGRLADLAGRALYDAAPCTAEDALHAADLGDTVRTGMARHAAPARPPVGV